MKLSEFVLPLIRARFSAQGMREPAEGPFAVFPATHPDVGDIELYDDGGEVVIGVGNFTHCHFTSYDLTGSESEKAVRIANDIVSFLDDIFSERVEFWGSHSGSGGVRRRGPQGELHKATSGTSAYVWSGPAHRDGA